MGAPNGRTGRPLTQTLSAQPWRFEFVQAARLLHQWAGAPFDLDAPPSRSPVRYGAAAGLSFSSAPVTQINLPAETAEDQADTNAQVDSSSQDGRSDQAAAMARMVVSFIGLTGPTGVLPQHYTAMLIERLREKDHSLREFFDLFNHRIVMLFLAAAQKYRFPLAYDQPANHAKTLDAFTSCLFSLVGMGAPSLRGRLDFDDRAVLFYAGLFAHNPPNAMSLQRMLADYFNLPPRVHQFQGQWLYLNPEDQSRMSSAAGNGASNNQLGLNIIVGQRVRDMQSKFRIILGPLSYADYCRFLPGGKSLRVLAQLVRLYVRMEVDFDVQPLLRAQEVPDCRMESSISKNTAPRCLGRNVWLKSSPYPREFSGAVFESPYV